MQGIQANVKMFGQTHRNKKSAEINVIEDPESVTESIWVRGLIQNGFEIWEGTSDNDLIIGNQERTNFIYAQWGDDDITGGDCVDHIIAGPGSNTVMGGGDLSGSGQTPSLLFSDFSIFIFKKYICS